MAYRNSWNVNDQLSEDELFNKVLDALDDDDPVAYMILTGVPYATWKEIQNKDELTQKSVLAKAFMLALRKDNEHLIELRDGEKEFLAKHQGDQMIADLLAKREVVLRDYPGSSHSVPSE